MPDPTLQSAAAAVPPGSWAVGVSGGADSVALLALLRGRGDLSLHVVHLDHQTRGAESTGDADFVAALAGQWNLPCTIGRIDRVEAKLKRILKNPSARYRAARMALFREVIAERALQGVILAHHADDHAETILQRLLRGSSFMGLSGMAGRSTVGGVLILRPLLEVRARQLRCFLDEIRQGWREDASNQSPQYARNRLRRVLQEHGSLIDPSLEMGAACQSLRDWVVNQAPRLEDVFPIQRLRDLPNLLAQQSARQWLQRQGSPAGELSPVVVQRLIDMATDAATAPRAHFPGQILVARRGGAIGLSTSRPPRR